MKQILHSILKKKIIKLVNDIANGVSEVIIDIELSIGVVNSLEIEKGQITLHIFKDDFDFGFDFDDLSEFDKLIIFETLNTI
jgi:hypothetical protein